MIHIRYAIAAYRVKLTALVKAHNGKPAGKATPPRGCSGRNVRAPTLAQRKRQ